ncbi:MAG: hydrogenase nickel incorporation protein HypB [Bacilli bacterium]|nr:hydrogenase nickel incorporation protein HypB [Bacilli bacterium]
MKIIELKETITASNDKDAEVLRNEMRKKGTLLINLMASPGAGKTTLLESTISLIKDEYKVGVMEADVDSDVDAVRVEMAGAKAIQVHTGGMCHMDAGMTRHSLEELDYAGLDVVFLENVGNLICPAEFDTGAGLKVMILSTPEGDDKPLKYPLMFSESDVLIISKMDVKDYFDFDLDKCIERAKKLNPNIIVFPVSAKTKEGLDDWIKWLKENIKKWKKGA